MIVVCFDGPLAGAMFIVDDCPRAVRCVLAADGTADILNAPEDAPRLDEIVHWYRIHTVGRSHVCGSGGCHIGRTVELHHAPDLRVLRAPDPVNPARAADVTFDLARHREALFASFDPQLQPAERSEPRAEGVPEHDPLTLDLGQHGGVADIDTAVGDPDEAGPATVSQVDGPPEPVGAGVGGGSAVDARDGHASGSCSPAGQNGRST